MPHTEDVRVSTIGSYLSENRNKPYCVVVDTPTADGFIKKIAARFPTVILRHRGEPLGTVTPLLFMSGDGEISLPSGHQELE